MVGRAWWGRFVRAGGDPAPPDDVRTAWGAGQVYRAYRNTKRKKRRTPLSTSLWWLVNPTCKFFPETRIKATFHGLLLNTILIMTAATV